MTLLYIILNLVGSGVLGYFGRSFRKPLPLTGWLDRLPAPRWPGRKKTPRSGARNDTRSRPRIEPAAKAQGRSRGTAGDCTRDNPRAAGAASARGAQPSGRRSTLEWLIRPTGCHAAELGLVIGTDGMIHHAETGPMAAVPDGYGADLRGAERLVRP